MPGIADFFFSALRPATFCATSTFWMQKEKIQSLGQSTVDFATCMYVSLLQSGIISNDASMGDDGITASHLCRARPATGHFGEGCRCSICMSNNFSLALGVLTKSLPRVMATLLGSDVSYSNTWFVFAFRHTSSISCSDKYAIAF